MPPENDPVESVPSTRRRFLGLGIAGLGAAAVVSAIGTIRFFFPKVLFEPPSVFLAGKPEDYRVGEVNEKYRESHRVWMIKDLNGVLYAVEANCTHLGCTPQWFSNEMKFKCPCHGTNFNVRGDVLAGPAPMPLFRVSIRLDARGRIKVDKRIKENRPEKRDQPPFVLLPEGRNA